MASGIFSEDRVNNISEIMPKLSEHVQVGDQILLGLEGDPNFPYEMSERPEGVVRNVSNTNGLVDLSVELNNGDLVKLSAGSIAPDQVWEFTEDSFRNVLERNIKVSSTVESAATPVDDLSAYRGSNDVSELKAMLETQIKENNEFNQTLVKTLNEIAKDVVSLNPEAKFCSVFASEYRGVME